MRPAMCIAFGLLCGCLASAAWGQPAAIVRPITPVVSEPPTLTVSGQGEVMAAPDQATIECGAAAQDPQASAAQDQVNQIMHNVLRAVAGLGIPESNIRTIGLVLTPVMSRPAPSRTETEVPRIIAYSASNTIQIQTDNLQLIGKIIDAAVKQGANRIEGVSFDLKNDTPQRQRALQLAVQAAQAKATAIAEAMNLRLGPVRHVIEGGVNVVRPQFSMGRAAMFAGAMATPVQSGQLRIQGSITVEFRLIEPAVKAP